MLHPSSTQVDGEALLTHQQQALDGMGNGNIENCGAFQILFMALDNLKRKKEKERFKLVKCQLQDNLKSKTGI